MFPFVKRHTILTIAEATQLWKKHFSNEDPLSEIKKLRRAYEVWYDRYGIMSEILDQDREKVLEVFEYYLIQEGIVPSQICS